MKGGRRRGHGQQAALVSPCMLAKRVPDYPTFISPMDPAKLAALLAVVAVVVCAVAAAPATDTAGYSGGGGGGAVAPAESCQTQIRYFTNCLARYEIRGQCCSVVESRECLCQLKREVALPCSLHRHHERKCSKGEQPPPSVKLAELQRLPCFRTLKC